MAEKDVRKALSITLRMQESHFDSPSALMREFSKLSRLSLKKIRSKTKREKVLISRQSLQYLLRTQLGMPYAEIGELTNTHHATVMNAEEKIKGYLDTYEGKIAPATPHHLRQSYPRVFTPVFFRNRTLPEDLRKALSVTLTMQGMNFASADDLMGKFVELSDHRSLDDILLKTRKESVVFYRQSLQYLLCAKTKMSYETIREMTHVNDHGTVMHAEQKTGGYLAAYRGQIAPLMPQAQAA